MFLPLIKARRPGGFTLLESLLVIACLAVVLGLLFPAFQTSRKSTAQVRCSANLRTLWVAMSGYLADHQGTYIPYGTSVDGLIWTSSLMDKGYLPVSGEPFFCPAFSGNTDLTTPRKVAQTTGGMGSHARGLYSHYGYNHGHIGGSQRYGGSSLPAKISQLTHPAQTVLFTETVRTLNNTTTPRGSYLVVDRIGSEHIPDPRHNGSVNTVFADGHVEAIRLKDPSNPFLPAPDGFGTTTGNGSLWKR
ncbi:MAG TPA: prepilin-type N-terminal cleavage/methylation domain-containing protein [Chthoniobacteraceae bacterium]|nr:prepilin-type N-terminal cleavage/methylation domain-containing protein [Chthoniobacteraceae bacterium]